MHANEEPKDKVEGGCISIMKVQVFYMLKKDWELLQSEAILMQT